MEWIGLKSSKTGILIKMGKFRDREHTRRMPCEDEDRDPPAKGYKDGQQTTRS